MSDHFTYRKIWKRQKAIPIIQQEQLFENVTDETIVLKGSKVDEQTRKEETDLNKKKKTK